MPRARRPAGSGQRGQRLFLPPGLEPGFDVAGRLRGPGGVFLRWIEARTGCSVSVHGAGVARAGPLDEVVPAHILVAPAPVPLEGGAGKDPQPPQLARAIRLCRALLASTLEDYKAYLEEKSSVDSLERKSKDQLAMNQEAFKGFKEWFFKQPKDVQIRLWNQHFKHPE